MIKKSKKNVEVLKQIKKGKLSMSIKLVKAYNTLCPKCRLIAYKKTRFRNKAVSYNDFCDDCKEKYERVING
jgi:hypothetical protein